MEAIPSRLRIKQAIRSKRAWSGNGATAASKIKTTNERKLNMSDAIFRTNEEQPRLLIDNAKLQELENAERARRAAEAAVKRRELEQAKATQAKEVDHVGDLTSALTSLENAVIDYRDNKENRPNWPLVNARQKVVLLQAQLDEAMKELRAEDAKGSWIDQLSRQIADAERALRQLLDSYSDRVMDQIVKKLCGESRTYKTASKEVKAIVRDHERTLGLRKFTLPSRPQPVRRQDPQTGRLISDGYSLEYLYKRAEEVASKLNARRAHIASEEEQAG